MKSSYFIAAEQEQVNESSFKSDRRKEYMQVLWRIMFTNIKFKTKKTRREIGPSVLKKSLSLVI